MGSGVARTSGVLVAVLLALSPVLVACGGDEEPEAEPTPSESTTSATSSPSPTKTEEPLSEFEDEAPVKAVRKWATAVGQAVNERQRTMESVGAWATPSGVDVSRRVYASDLDAGYEWPGPQPFTPVRVSTDGGSATMVGCFLSSGWSRDPKSGKRVAKREVDAFRFELARRGKRWKVSDISNAPADCSGVEVKGVRW